METTNTNTKERKLLVLKELNNTLQLHAERIKLSSRADNSNNASNETTHRKATDLGLTRNVVSSTYNHSATAKSRYVIQPS